MTSLKKVSFFKDGDVNFSGVNLTITGRRFQTLEQLVTELNRKVPLTNGVRTITTPMGFHKINDLNELENGKKYVCSSNRHIKKLDYEHLNKKSEFKVPRRPLSKKGYQPFKKNDADLFKSRQKIKKVNLISKLDSNNIMGIVLTNRVKYLEEVINDASEVFGCRVSGLFTIQGKKVTSVSDLFTGGETYIADICTSNSSLRSLPIIPYKSSITPELKSSGARLNNSVKLSSPIKGEATAVLSGDEKEILWLITIRTSDVPQASSDHLVHITLYGSNGNTGKYQLSLPLHMKNYYQDSVNEAEIKLKDVGSLYKIRVGHEENGTTIGWHLQYILLTNLVTNKEYLFNCNRWLSREKDDGEVVRELPLYKNGKPRFSVQQYTVEIHTGEDENGCTNNDVYITIEGENGDTGKRLLMIKDRMQAFRSANVSVFQIEAVDLGDIKNIVLLLDHQKDEKEWFVEKVVIKDQTRNKNYNFPLKKKLVKGKSKVQIKPRNGWKAETSEENLEKENEKKNECEPIETAESMTINQNSTKAKEKPMSDLGQKLMKNEIQTEKQIKEDKNEKENYEKSCEEYGGESEYRISRHLQGKSEVVLISKLSGKSLCYNKKKDKLHATGEENVCCWWMLLEGNDSTKLLFSTYSDGYISMDESQVTFNLGNPGLLNEFILIVSDDNTCLFESVVHNGNYLSCDQNGKISVTTDVSSEGVKFQCFMKNFIRDKTEVQFISHYDGSILADVSNKPRFLLQNEEEKSTFVISKFDHTNSPLLIALKNKESGSFISVEKKSLKVTLKKTEISNKHCGLKFQKAGDIFQFESSSVPKHYLSKDEKTGQLTLISNAENARAKFIIKVLKGGEIRDRHFLEESCRVLKDANNELSDSQSDDEDDELLYRDENYFSPLSESSQSDSSDDESDNSKNEDTSKESSAQAVVVLSNSDNLSPFPMFNKDGGRNQHHSKVEEEESSNEESSNEDNKIFNKDDQKHPDEEDQKHPDEEDQKSSDEEDQTTSEEEDKKSSDKEHKKSADDKDPNSSDEEDQKSSDEEGQKSSDEEDQKSAGEEDQEPSDEKSHGFSTDDQGPIENNQEFSINEFKTVEVLNNENTNNEVGIQNGKYQGKIKNKKASKSNQKNDDKDKEEITRKVDEQESKIISPQINEENQIEFHREDEPNLIEHNDTDGLNEGNQTSDESTEEESSSDDDELNEENVKKEKNEEEKYTEELDESNSEYNTMDGSIAQGNEEVVDQGKNKFINDTDDDEWKHELEVLAKDIVLVLINSAAHVIESIDESIYNYSDTKNDITFFDSNVENEISENQNEERKIEDLARDIILFALDDTFQALTHMNKFIDIKSEALVSESNDEDGDAIIQKGFYQNENLTIEDLVREIVALMVDNAVLTERDISKYTDTNNNIILH